MYAGFSFRHFPEGVRTQLSACIGWLRSSRELEESRKMCDKYNLRKFVYITYNVKLNQI